MTKNPLEKEATLYQVKVSGIDPFFFASSRLSI